MTMTPATGVGQDVLDAFGKVLPETGYVCIAEFGNGRVRHKWFHNRSGLIQWVRIHGLQNPSDVYFAFASFKDRRRVKANVLHVQTLVLDVDIGKDGGYATQLDAIDGLTKLVRNGVLPKPSFVVSSGNGLHLYWLLGKPLLVDEWQGLARGWRDYLKRVAPKLAIDTARVTDPAGLLRFPGTMNRKDLNNPKPVELLAQTGAVYTQDDIKRYTGDTAPVVTPARFTSQVDTSLSPATTVPADVLVDSCKLFQHAYTNQVKASYDEWWCTVQLCAFTDKPAALAKLMSERYPGFNQQELNEKLASAQQSRADGVGPVTCDRYAAACGRADICQGCALKHLGKSPIAIALKQSIAREKEQARKQVVSRQADGARRVQAALQLMQEQLGVKVELDGHGNVLARAPKQDAGVLGEEELFEIFPRVAVPIGTRVLPSGDFAVDVALASADGSRIMTVVEVPLKLLGTQQGQVGAMELLGCAMPYGLEKKAKRYRAWLGAIAAVANQLRETVRSYNQMGLVPEGYVLGDELFQIKDGQLVSQKVSVSPTLAQLAEGFGTSGTAAQQKYALQKIIPAMTPEALYYFLSAPASLLLHMTGISGAIVHLSGSTGLGKTTLNELSSSLFGQPQSTITSIRDTVNAAEAKLKALGNFPMYYDEITSDLINPYKREAIVDLIYSVTNGRGRDRATRTGELRRAPDRWNLIMLSTANASMMATIKSIMPDNTVATALAMRVVELQADRFFVDRDEVSLLDIEEAKANYGHVGRKFVEAILRLKDDLKEVLLQRMSELNAQYGVESRFINGVHAAVELTAEILWSLLDMRIPKSILEHIRQQLAERTETIRRQVQEISDPIGQLQDVITNIGDAVAVFSENDNGDMTLLSTPARLPQARVEYKQGMVVVYVARAAFDTACMKLNINAHALLEALRKRNYLHTRADGQLHLVKLAHNVPDKGGMLYEVPPARSYIFIIPQKEYQSSSTP